MGLDALVRSGVALAKQLTADLQVSVSHEAVSSRDLRGKPTYAAAVSRPAIVEKKQRLVRDTTGREVMCSHVISFLQPVSLSVEDRLTLPDGTTGPILSIEGLVDAGTNARFYVIVYLG
jgi:hypothetical protein